MKLLILGSGCSDEGSQINLFSKAPEGTHVTQLLESHCRIVILGIVICNISSTLLCLINNKSAFEFRSHD